MKVSNTVEVISVSLTDAGTYLLGLRKLGHGEPTEDTSADEVAMVVTGMFPDELIPKDKKAKMAEAMRESMVKASQAQRERHDQLRPHYELQPQYKMEVSSKEYEDLGHPGVGTLAVLSMEA